METKFLESERVPTHYFSIILHQPQPRIEDDEMSPLNTDGKAFDDKTLLKRLSQLFQGSQFHIEPT